jgi:uncharacterized tellurite resistance protein B-like protein
MSILLGLLAIMGVAGTLLWRLNHAADAAREIADTADTARGLFRRWRWRRRTHVDLLAEIKDPREAAACMMVSLAQSDGALSERERTTILRAMIEHFQATASQAEDLFARARWLVRDVGDAAACFVRLQPLVMEKLATAERRDLVAMLIEVAKADGEPRTAEREAIARLQEHLFPN